MVREGRSVKRFGVKWPHFDFYSSFSYVTCVLYKNSSTTLSFNLHCIFNHFNHFIQCHKPCTMRNVQRFFYSIMNFSVPKRVPQSVSNSRRHQHHFHISGILCVYLTQKMVLRSLSIPLKLWLEILWTYNFFYKTPTKPLKTAAANKPVCSQYNTCR